MKGEVSAKGLRAQTATLTPLAPTPLAPLTVLLLLLGANARRTNLARSALAATGCPAARSSRHERTAKSSAHRVAPAPECAVRLRLAPALSSSSAVRCEAPVSAIEAALMSAVTPSWSAVSGSIPSSSSRGSTAGAVAVAARSVLPRRATSSG